jgi:hypothetical protein
MASGTSAFPPAPALVPEHYKGRNPGCSGLRAGLRLPEGDRRDISAEDAAPLPTHTRTHTRTHAHTLSHGTSDTGDLLPDQPEAISAGTAWFPGDCTEQSGWEPHKEHGDDSPSRE